LFVRVADPNANVRCLCCGPRVGEGEVIVPITTCEKEQTRELLCVHTLTRTSYIRVYVHTYIQPVLVRIVRRRMPLSLLSWLTQSPNAHTSSDIDVYLTNFALSIKGIGCSRKRWLSLRRAGTNSNSNRPSSRKMKVHTCYCKNNR
jgi:hypothetical protein